MFIHYFSNRFYLQIARLDSRSMVEGWQAVYPQETNAKVDVFYVFHTHNILDYMSFNDQINTLKIYLLLMSRCSLSTTILVILLLDETILM